MSRATFYRPWKSPLARRLTVAIVLFSASIILVMTAVHIYQEYRRDLATDNDDLAIVRAIIALARALRLSVIAEGVETAEQLALLRREDCHEYQGYFFAHPMDADSIDGQLQPSRAASGP